MVRIAAAQTAPVWGDADATAEIVVEWVRKAGAEGVELVAFGEAFLSGYPYWLARTDAARFDASDQKEAYAYYLAGAIEVDGPQIASIASVAREVGVFAYLGVTERSASGGTVYATYLAIDPDRGVVSAHRKLMPTYEERMAWGSGDGNGLRTHQVGEFTVSGLNCWENWVPTIRHVMYAQGTTLHVAGWPGSVRNTRDITRFIALEGRCYVMSASALLRSDSIPAAFPLRSESLNEGEVLLDGGSAIAAAVVTWVVEPVANEQRLVVADIDLDRVRGERQNFDPAGHYFRSDVIQVHVDRERLGPASFSDQGRS